MIISKSRSFVFVHIPKCGGAVFRQMLNIYNDDPRQFWNVQRTAFLNIPLDHAHLRTWELQIFFPDTIQMLRDYRSVCFFRNPLERFVSAIYEHHAQFRPDVCLSTLSWQEQQRIARDFAADFTLDQAFSSFNYIHFSPQTWFTHLAGERLVKMIIPMISGFDAFRAAMVYLELPDCPGSTRSGNERNPLDLLGRDLMERVRDLYEADYRFYSENDHLRPLSLL